MLISLLNICLRSTSYLKRKKILKSEEIFHKILCWARSIELVNATDSLQPPPDAAEWMKSEFGKVHFFIL